MAFHLLYSKSGLQLEAKLPELIHGLHTGDLGDLSQTQLRKVDDLQQRTSKREKEISEKMAKQQESVADSSTVELSNVVSEMIMIMVGMGYWRRRILRWNLCWSGRRKD